jgi:hypothetical protein
LLSRLFDCRFGRYDFIFSDSSGLGLCLRCQSFSLGLSVSFGLYRRGLSISLSFYFCCGLSICFSLQRYRGVSFIGCTSICCRLAFGLSTTLLLDKGCTCIRKCSHCRCNVAVGRVESVCVGQYVLSCIQVATVDL